MHSYQQITTTTKQQQQKASQHMPTPHKCIHNFDIASIKHLF